LNDKEIESYKNIDDVKCPYCKNPIIWKHFSHWLNETACFIAECWSGRTSIEKPRHLFKIWVEIDKEVSVEQEVSK